MDIRPYQKTDKEACIKAFQSNIPIYFTKEEKVDYDQFLDHLEEGKTAANTMYYVLADSNGILGAGGFGEKDGEGKLTLAWGLVHAEHHKKGYGKLLLNHRLEQIEKLFPEKSVLLDTTQHTYSFFEKFGFVITKITHDFYTQGLHRYDMIKQPEPMNQAADYINLNKKTWNARVETHVASEFYSVQEFIEGRSSLQSIELELLGDIRGKRILHLQCHFGQDTLSLARMGAMVTGVDFSETAIEKAKELASQMNLEAEFICSDIFQLNSLKEESFDMIFTTYGTIGWLPELNSWAEVISRHLKPGGRLLFVEFHPVVWMFDNDFDQVAYSYFNEGPIQEIELGTYANREAAITLEYICWNHSLGEVFGALRNSGLQINYFNEYDYSPYNCFKNTREIEQGKYCIEKLGQKLPMVYAIEAQKK